MTLFARVKHNARQALKRDLTSATAIATIIILIFVGIQFMDSALFDIQARPDIISDYLAYGESAVPFWDFFYNSFGIVAISLVTFLTLSPLMLGAKKWYFTLSDGEYLEFGLLFSAFRSVGTYFSSLGVKISLFVRRLTVFCVFLLPGLSVVSISLFTYYRLPEEANLWSIGVLLGAVLILFGVLFAAVVCCRYYLVEYYFLEGVDISDAIKLSTRATKGRLWRLFSFNLSFLMWWIGALFVFPLLYSYSYISVSKGIFARYIMQDYYTQVTGNHA